ncbi:hypothetical protein [Planctobacterium marinum]|nr:hypothetical protein [Planctobacterium marinum]
MQKIAYLTLIILLWSFSQAQAVEIGFSGMARINADSFLVVTDKKGYQQGDRLGVLKTRTDAIPEFTAISIADWKHSDGQASDLESVCQIPGKSNEFLLAESGYWKGQFGRLFHIALTIPTAVVKTVYQLPMLTGSDDKIDGDNFEGIVCLEHNRKFYVVLGERGGSEAYPNGVLRIGVLDYDRSLLSWDEYQDKAVTVVAPELWGNPQLRRTISDLHLDNQGTVWAVATEDAGDEGPFRSIVYPAASVTDATHSEPLQRVNAPKIFWQIDGFKVEALAAPSVMVPGSVLSIGTEDESYGGTWRPLFAAPQ